MMVLVFLDYKFIRNATPVYSEGNLYSAKNDKSEHQMESNSFATNKAQGFFFFAYGIQFPSNNMQ